MLGALGRDKSGDQERSLFLLLPHRLLQESHRAAHLQGTIRLHRHGLRSHSGLQGKDEKKRKSNIVFLFPPRTPSSPQANCYQAHKVHMHKCLWCIPSYKTRSRGVCHLLGRERGAATGREMKKYLACRNITFSNVP